MEDNTAIQIWSEKTQQEKGNSLAEGYMSEDFTRISVTQNNLQELKEKRVDVFMLSIYGLVIFSKALGHIDEVEKVSYRVFSENYSLLKEFLATSRRDNISNEKWIMILQNLQDEDVEWKAPWMTPDEILYRYGDFD
ncbi:hypothetical protein Gohar_008316 [Gossypium harknessii]|uniref:Uncharacterized protein n=1 Tax=Gossypium harknessii TaxID=34285 RepID=A0A7J9GJB0_9ROSI|nr:hypothetical protein [Gossypium harknessii]